MAAAPGAGLHRRQYRGADFARCAGAGRGHEPNVFRRAVPRRHRAEPARLPDVPPHRLGETDAARPGTADRRYRARCRLPDAVPFHRRLQADRGHHARPLARVRHGGGSVMRRKRMSGRIVFAAVLCLAAPAASADGVQIDEVIVAVPIPEAQRAAIVKAATEFYEFWNTGDAALLKNALAPDFIDRTLPPGRPQGPDGPAFASEHFRAAVPDLRVEIRKMIVAGDYVTVHMN